MCRDGVGSSRKKVYQRGSTKRVPQLSDIHIPVGGPRLRPTLEDLLEMLIHDLGVDHADDALKVLEEQRVRWRVTQVQAIAKSMPNIVADAWLAQCDQEPTARTWAPTLVALRHAIIDVIILAADLPDDAVVDVRLIAGEDLGDDVVRAIELGNRRADLHAAQVALREDTLASVRDLLDAGYSVRDVAGAVGLSPGRVAQIA